MISEMKTKNLICFKLNSEGMTTQESVHILVHILRHTSTYVTPVVLKPPPHRPHNPPLPLRHFRNLTLCSKSFQENVLDRRSRNSFKPEIAVGDTIRGAGKRLDPNPEA